MRNGHSACRRKAGSAHLCCLSTRRRMIPWLNDHVSKVSFSTKVLRSSYGLDIFLALRVQVQITLGYNFSLRAVIGKGLRRLIDANPLLVATYIEERKKSHFGSFDGCWPPENSQIGHRDPMYRN